MSQSIELAPLVIPVLSLLATLYVAAKVHVMQSSVTGNTVALQKIEQAVQDLRKEFTDAESAKALWASGIIGRLEKVEEQLAVIGNLEELHKKVSAVIADVRELTHAIREATGLAVLAGETAVDAQAVAEKAVKSITDLGKNPAAATVKR